jgi:hypothetical protein
MNECVMTIGFIMAVVCDHQSDKSTPNPQHDVPMAFCFTADGENNSLIQTPEMLQLYDRGYSPIAIIRFDPNMPKKLAVRTRGVLPECLQSELSKKAEGLVHEALSGLARKYN